MQKKNDTKNNLLFPLKHEDVDKIFSYSPDIYFIHINGIIKYINEAGVKFFGAVAERDLIGNSIWNIYSADVHGLVRSRIQQTLETNAIAPFIQLTLKDKDDKNRIVECANIGINYEGVPAVFVIMRDISASTKAQELLTLQYSISKNLVINNSLENALLMSIKLICTTINADLGRVWTLDNTTNLLTCLVAWIKPSLLENENAINILKPEPLYANAGYVGTAFHSDETIWHENENMKEKYKTTITVPLHSYKDIIGVLEISFEKNVTKDESILDALVQSSYQLGAYIKRKMFEKELIYLSYHDPITGLINRHLFEQTLDSEIKLATNNNQKLALLLLDINNFREINTRIGHASGDILLRLIAEKLLSLGFTIDRTSRIENDQFAIIFHNAQSVAYITEQINKINAALAEKFKVLDAEASVTVNIGVAQFPEDGSNSTELMRSADIALKIATQAGNGKFQFSSLELTDNAWQKLNMENSIRDAFANNEFHLDYQPIVDCKDFTTIGFEALLRWNKGGVPVPTAVFIPLLEKNGLFPMISGWIIRTACEQSKLWQAQTSRPIYVSVNLSIAEFKDPNLLYELTSILNDLDFNAKCLTLEITETTLMNDKEMGMQKANKIRALGVKLAIDDFGAGYSSLNYLVHVPMDFIKIDKLFIDDICSDPKVIPIVKAAIDLGDALQYKAVAEGVETKEQMEVLISLGCPYIQGYFFSKPMSASDTLEFLKQDKINIGN